ncbi:MAG: aminomethyl-transferring glycine dehydrogenase subunit GcvPB [Deltaproteobacteria bacterium]|nr:aminomethyl-transferring glycine dehydrogenase subunit GcvPB [Deltaproteobacteria bacterium]
MIEGQGTTGLVLKEPTIFERSSAGRQGYALPALDVPEKQPVRFVRHKAAELPEVSELEVVRHFTRLSNWNYSVDLGMFPLGSCTMKYNPRINEEIAALPGLSVIHPDLPAEHCQGALEIIYCLEKLLCGISGMDECTAQPSAGAQGELTGLMIVRAFHESLGSSRKIVLVPDTAHGTNPASSVLAGYQAITLKSSSSGILNLEDVRGVCDKFGRDIAAMMITNPNTLGLFESNIIEISQALHNVGAQLYMDGANLNAIMGYAKPSDMGVDVMQFNLHKTFSTPHGGGGPGAGPVAVRSHLAPYLPNPRIRLVEGKYVTENLKSSIGKVRGYYGNFGVLVRALAYILQQGADGLKQVSKAAVLNANYLRHRLSSHFAVPYRSPHFHECVLTDAIQIKENGVKTLAIAKALIDQGFHPPTIYFPLVVGGAMLIEPTETESLQELDKLIDAFITIAEAIRTKKDNFEHAPRKTIVGKVDEVRAARQPILSLDDRAQ